MSDIEPIRLVSNRPLGRPDRLPSDPSDSLRSPLGRPVMTQDWRNLTYVHWRFDPTVVQRLLPSGFVVDTFDGSAWVGLIPFEMENIAFPLTDRINVKTGRFGSFPETNVRTYIIGPTGRRGVWFFSLDINRVAPTLIARVGYGLPYCFADMSVKTVGTGIGQTIRYESERRWPSRSQSVVHVKRGELIEVKVDELDAFTSARWALGSRFLRRNVWAEVDHPTWILHEAELLQCDQTLFRAAGLPEPKGQPVVRWSPGVHVKIARPRLVR
jgi:uncharacterized protein